MHDISVALGVDPGVADSRQLRYHKVCILADADSDGQHIATLLCALFLRHFRPLVANGHVYVAMPPLYRIDAGKQVLYALDDAERDARSSGSRGRARARQTRGDALQGPGRDESRRSCARPPSTRARAAWCSSPSTAKDKTDQLMDMLLAKKRAGDRREWLESKGNQAEVLV